ncbi:MAG: PD-(D/E)XK nuclease family protein [Waterburya sp.]
MNQPGLIRLSQSHLNLLSICPPKFQQVYLDGLGALPDVEQQESMQWGSRFHLLMQQRELTLPIESLLTIDSELDSSLKALIQAVPDLLEQNPDIWREAEHYRTFIVGQFLLTVIYDLLIIKPDQAIILDWKTYRQPPNSSKLANNWQTRLYLYVLANTSDYSPEQIQMTYWFVKSGKPKSLTFHYSQELHQQTEQDLADLLTNLAKWWQNYQDSQSDQQLNSDSNSKAEVIGNLPHRIDCQENCPYSQILTEEKQQRDRHQEWLTSINEIEEISI